MNNEDQSHYEMQNEDFDDKYLYGEEFNQKVIDELDKIPEKGADYSATTQQKMN